VDSPKTQEFLGVDAGSVRVGIARGNNAARLAEPLKTVPAGKAVGELKELASENSAAGIVVGLPRGLDGGETAQTTTVRQWVESAKTAISLPFYWQDEALTSRQAEEAKASPAGNDAAAAAIILQDFLDSRESDRVTA
jgi:putative Holliday junction resolvase